MNQTVLDADAREKMLSLRNGSMGLEEFQSWVKAQGSRLEAMLSPGLLLKLKRGDAGKVMSAVAHIMPACATCSAICSQGVFNSRVEHASCASKVDAAISANNMKRIPRPAWIKDAGSQLGADGYYSCLVCGAAWTLVEPEKQENGLWERLA